MLKFLGSGIALAVGAGALYYWWTHEQHRDFEGAMDEAGDRIEDAGDKTRDAIEDL